MKPKTLSELKHGNLLTKGNYPTFVETFNYAVKRLDNLLGDKDVNPQTGTIRVDNTDPEHPVIRCDKPILNGNGAAVAFGDSDLSSVGLSSVHVANLSGTPYIQLYNFDKEPTEQTGANIDNSQGTFEIGSGDWFLVKNGDELYYKKIVLSTDLSGSGGGGGGSISVDSEIQVLNRRSLEHVVQAGNDYYELYGFHDSTNTQTQLSNYEYVVRHNDGNGNYSVKYLSADLTASSCPANFDYYTRPDGTHWLRSGYFQQARRFYWVGSTEITASGMIQLSVSMQYTTSIGVIQGASSLPDPTISTMYVPLWQIGQDMKPTFDYRNAPMLPRWE